MRAEDQCAVEETQEIHWLKPVARQRGAPCAFPSTRAVCSSLVVAAAEPVKKFESGKPREAWAARTDENGELLWRVQVVALGDGEAEIIRVVMPGQPAPPRPPVRPDQPRMHDPEARCRERQEHGRVLSDRIRHAFAASEAGGDQVVGVLAVALSAGGAHGLAAVPARLAQHAVRLRVRRPHAPLAVPIAHLDGAPEPDRPGTPARRAQPGVELSQVDRAGTLGQFRKRRVGGDHAACPPRDGACE